MKKVLSTFIEENTLKNGIHQMSVIIQKASKNDRTLFMYEKC